MKSAPPDAVVADLDAQDAARAYGAPDPVLHHDRGGDRRTDCGSDAAEQERRGQVRSDMPVQRDKLIRCPRRAVAAERVRRRMPAGPTQWLPASKGNPDTTSPIARSAAACNCVAHSPSQRAISTDAPPHVLRPRIVPRLVTAAPERTARPIRASDRTLRLGAIETRQTLRPVDHQQGGNR